jgi:hypothetical protein
MGKSKVIPYDLDWGIATSDGFSEKDQQLLFVFNVDISSVANIERTIVFVVGRVLWFNMHVPTGTEYKVVFDLRGQPLTLLGRARKMKSDILEKVAKLNKVVNVIIEILI